jgi:hypothetical protein
MRADEEYIAMARRRWGSPEAAIEKQKMPAVWSELVKITDQMPRTVRISGLHQDGEDLVSKAELVLAGNPPLRERIRMSDLPEGLERLELQAYFVVRAMANGTSRLEAYKLFAAAHPLMGTQFNGR